MLEHLPKSIEVTISRVVVRLKKINKVKVRKMMEVQEQKGDNPKNVLDVPLMCDETCRQHFFRHPYYKL